MTHGATNIKEQMVAYVTVWNSQFPSDTILFLEREHMCLNFFIHLNLWIISPPLLKVWCV